MERATRCNSPGRTTGASPEGYAGFFGGPAPFRQLIQAARRIVTRTPLARPHDWRITCRNWAGAPTERRCWRCRQYQHLKTFREIFDNPWWFERQRDEVDQAPWHDGPHPIAEDMRRQGITQNFRRGDGRRRRKHPAGESRP